MQEIEQFKRQNELSGDEGQSEATGSTLAYPEEVDLRAEDDELIAAELEAAMEAERAKAGSEAQAEEEIDEESTAATARSRRGRRGRRSGSRGSGPLEATFDHGEEGYGLWLDPAVQDNPIYAEHWAGHRPVAVTIEEDQIVIRRAGEDG